MTKRNLVFRIVLPTTALSFILVSGCSPESDKQTSNPNSLSSESSTPESKLPVDVATMDSDEEHGHKPGAHGGIMVSLGRDSYHVEAVVDSEGFIRLYTLGQDESRVIEVESQTLNGFVKAEGDADSKAIAFTPSPQDGDSDGKTSLFVGQLPADLVGRKLDVTIPNIRINGERFRLGFISGQDGHDGEHGMPTKVADGAEAELYLTAGGRYTAADIAANGNVTASQKFKGIKSVHDMKPKVGDMLCPISGTKANPQFTWIIDGKPYEFCCPPCIDEFLASAKESSDPIPDPESFIKQ